MENNNPAKINGYTKGNDQFLAAGFEMYTVTTPGTADMTNKFVLDAVIQTISTVCAPVLLGTPTATTLVFAVDKKGLPIAGTSAGGNFKTVQEMLVALGSTTVNTVFDAAGVGSAPANFAATTVVAGVAYGA